MRASVLFLLWAVPAPVWACAVCFDAADETRQAFVDTTIFLTALPLLLMGAGGYWVYRTTVQSSLK